MKSNQTPSTKESAKAFNWKRALVLVISTAFALGLYFYLIRFSFWQVVMIAYIVTAAVLIVAYFIINRAFTGSGVTYEMLPDTMTHKEKEEYLDDVAERERRSRPLLMIIFPVVITLMVDLFRLFVIDGLFSK